MNFSDCLRATGAYQQESLKVYLFRILPSILKIGGKYSRLRIIYSGSLPRPQSISVLSSAMTHLPAHEVTGVSFQGGQRKTQPAAIHSGILTSMPRVMLGSSTVLYCAVLYYTALYCTVLYCTVLTWCWCRGWCWAAARGRCLFSSPSAAQPPHAGSRTAPCITLYCTVLHCTVL